MNPVKTSLFAATGVTMAALAVVFGSVARERIDMGGSLARNRFDSGASIGGLLAANSRGQDVPEGDFFREMVRLLKREFVEPITDDRKLAIGAIKGMVNSLKDPRSMFMDEGQFKTYMSAVEGKYHGIGVDLALQLRNAKAKAAVPGSDDVEAADMAGLSIPRLTVIAVAAGSPAEQAGVKPGDWVDTVDGHWVLNPDPVEEYRQAIRNASPTALKTLPAEESKKRQDRAREIGNKLRSQLKTMLMPLKARDRLIEGAAGTINIVWRRGDQTRSTSIAKRETTVPTLTNDSGVVSLRFADGAAEKLKQAVAGKQEITLDLRDNAKGDFEEMRECLAAVAPAGTYGEIYSAKPNKSRNLALSSGNPKPPKMTILVDNSTRGAAEIFATALSTHGLAKMSGKPSGDVAVVEVVGLPDGSGYTLVTGEYRPFPAKPQAAQPKRAASVVKERPRQSVAMREPDGSIVAMRGFGGNA